MSEKSLAVMYLWLFFVPEGERFGAFPDHRSRSGWKKFKKLAQTEVVGSIIGGTESQNGNSG